MSKKYAPSAYRTGKSAVRTSTDYIAVGVRNPITRKTKKWDGYFQSRKLGASVPWESRLEKDYLYLLEYDFDVVSFLAQPEAMKLEVEGKLVKHFPDFFVEYADGRCEFIEVKYRKQAKKDKYINVARAAKKAAYERGFTYRLLTELSIKKQPRLNNCKELFCYREQGLSDFSTMAVRHSLPNHPISLGDVCRLVGCNYYVGLAIIANGLLKADLFGKINAETLVIVNWDL